MSARADRVRGALVGAIVGDAFGAPLEGASPTKLDEVVDARAAASSPWSYTDDGAMSIAVAEAIAASGTVDPVAVLQRIAAHYEPARGFGRGLKMAIEAFARGTPWDRCAFVAWPEGSRGNGGAVRVTPVACARWASTSMLLSAAEMTTRVTHAHHEAIACARAHAAAVALALDTAEHELEPSAFLASLLDILRDEPAWVQATLLQIAALIEGDVGPIEAARALGTSPLARESVFAALWAFLSRGTSVAESVTTAARLGGDTDSICAMAGALSGAVHGLDAIPDAWLRNLDHERAAIEGLIALGDRIARIEVG